MTSSRSGPVRTATVVFAAAVVATSALVAAGPASAEPVCVPSLLGTTTCTYTNPDVIEPFFFPPGLQSFYATAVGQRGEGDSAPAARASSLIPISSIYPGSDAVAILVGTIARAEYPTGSRGAPGPGTPPGNRGGAPSMVFDTACCPLVMAGGSGGGGAAAGAGSDATITASGAGGISPAGSGGAGSGSVGGSGAPGGAQRGGSGGGGGIFGGGGGAPGSAGGSGSSLGERVTTSMEPPSVKICYGFDPWSALVCRFTIGSGSS